MSGSKKGERRGNAKKRMTDALPVKPKRAQVVPQKYTEDYMRQIALVVNGVRGGDGYLPPREMIKAAQDFFHDQVKAAQQTLVVIRRELEATEPGDRARMDHYERQLMIVSQELRSDFMMAAEMGFKNLPYFHAKISPSADSGTAGSPLDLLMLMFREIDELSRGKPSWMPGQLKLVSSK
jgi:hypothetical protein